MEQDIRWKQRVSSYGKALQQLTEGIETNRGTTVSLIKDGIVQRFEFTHELAWKVMRDFCRTKGIRI